MCRCKQTAVKHTHLHAHTKTNRHTRASKYRHNSHYVLRNVLGRCTQRLGCVAKTGSVVIIWKVVLLSPACQQSFTIFQDSKTYTSLLHTNLRFASTHQHVQNGCAQQHRPPSKTCSRREHRILRICMPDFWSVRYPVHLHGWPGCHDFCVDAASSRTTATTSTYNMTLKQWRGQPQHRLPSQQA